MTHRPCNAFCFYGGRIFDVKWPFFESGGYFCQLGTLGDEDPLEPCFIVHIDAYVHV